MSLVTELLRAGASLYVPPGVRLLWSVLDYGEVFHQLLSAGADPAELSCQMTVRSYPSTALFYTGGLSVMRTLVSLGIDVNARDSNGRTILFRVCKPRAHSTHGAGGCGCERAGLYGCHSAALRPAEWPR